MPECDVAHGLQLTHWTPSTMGNREETSSAPPSRRDSLAIASTLPVELLQMIFSYYAEYKDFYVKWCNSRPIWVAVTHVCRRWRAAALSCSSLWTSIDTLRLAKGWIKAFMERSEPSLIDVRIDDTTPGIGGGVSVDELIALFAGCTRLRSLHIIGGTSIVCKILDVLHTATQIRSLSLNISVERSVELPDNLFGGQAPIREVCFVVTASYIVAPHWLLRGITHFTSNQQIPLQILLDTLGQMPVLHSFTLERCILNWKGTDAPRDVQIQLPNLMYFTVDVDAGSPIIFALLHRRLSLPDGAKRRLHSHLNDDSYASKLWSPSILAIPPSLREVIQAANGLQRIQFSGGSRVGSFRLWTGDMGYEEAKLSLEFSWDFSNSKRKASPVSDLAALCGLLRVERARILTLLMNSEDPIGLGKSFWWTLLRKLPSVEVLELCPDAVRELHYARREGGVPPVFPELRGLRVVRAANSTVSTTSDLTEMTEDLMRILQGEAKH